MISAETARRRLSSAINNNFGDACVMSWLSGSFAYGGAQVRKSDIDIVIIFHADAVANGPLLTAMERFVDEYLAVHRDAELVPDLDFPGEYLNPGVLRDCVRGRGFDIQSGRLTLKPVPSSSYWTEDWRRWYRAWTSMIACSSYLTGNRVAFDAYKREGWRLLLKFVLLRSRQDTLSTEAIPARLAVAGVKPSYVEFEAAEATYIATALHELEREGFVVSEGDAWKPQLAQLEIWERELLANLGIPADPANLFLSIEQTENLARYATTKWAGPGHS